MKETFECPSCGQMNNIEWDPNEQTRVIPCLGCYGEDWIPAKGDESSLVMDPKKGKMVYTRMETDATKITHGAKLLVVRGTGPSCKVNS